MLLTLMKGSSLMLDQPACQSCDFQPSSTAAPSYFLLLLFLPGAMSEPQWFTSSTAPTMSR